MNKLLVLIIGFGSMAIASANSSVSYEVNAKNTSKLASYIKGNSCTDIGKEFSNNGWIKYQEPGFPKDYYSRPAELDFPNTSNHELFKKHKELYSCVGFANGECYGQFSKGKYIVDVQYNAEGGGGFEQPHCKSTSYAVITID